MDSPLLLCLRSLGLWKFLAGQDEFRRLPIFPPTEQPPLPGTGLGAGPPKRHFGDIGVGGEVSFHP